MLAHLQPVPDGLEVDHLCGNQARCKPEHLEAVTRGEIVARIYRRTLVGAKPPVRSSPRSIHVRQRKTGDRYLVAWRDYFADGSTVQRGKQFTVLAEAQAEARR